MLLRQICDFGLSKWKEYSQLHTSARSKRDKALTHIPPEYWRGVALDAKYDIYSFAFLLWELITRKQPYKKGIFVYYRPQMWRSNVYSRICLSICNALTFESLRRFIVGMSSE